MDLRRRVLLEHVPGSLQGLSSLSSSEPAATGKSGKAWSGALITGFVHLQLEL